MIEIELLKPGDPCPCCGAPIVTEDVFDRLLLTWMKAKMGGDSAVVAALEKDLKETMEDD